MSIIAWILEDQVAVFVWFLGVGRRIVGHAAPVQAEVILSSDCPFLKRSDLLTTSDNLRIKVFVVSTCPGLA